MKKTSILLISLALVMLFASSAFAAQAMYFTTSGMAYATSTTVVSVTYNDFPLTVGKRIYYENKFKADGKTNYPYEIYLPNENNPEQYRIHTNYTKDTDSCASCHATHTATGPSLLQWYTVYETCMACHDGTVTTTYNVVTGNIGKTTEPTFGGHFATSQENSGSSHNVTGGVSIAAAPGGINADYTAGGTLKWNIAFGCESCHTPHGQGGNARILNPNPNGIIAGNTDYTTQLERADGVGGAVYIYNNSDRVELLRGYPYTVNIYTGASVNISAYFTVTSVGDSTYGAYTKIVRNSVTAIPPTTLDDINKVTGQPALKVRMAISNYLLPGEKVKHISGINEYCGACHTDYDTSNGDIPNGKNIIMGDATTRPGMIDNGQYSKAHRHAVGLKWNYGGIADKQYIGWDKLMPTMGKVTTTELGESGTSDPNNSTYISCLTCHFAHGTSEVFWGRFLANSNLPPAEKTYWATTNQPKEAAGSSALKRLPNMGTCEACHQKQESNEAYNANTSLASTTGTANPDVRDGFYTVVGATYEGTSCAAKAGVCHQHQDIIASFATTKHDNVNPNAYNGACDDQCHNSTNKDSGVGIKCESCHNAAGNHVRQPNAKNIINPRFLNAAGQTAICDSCHKEVGNYSIHTGTYRWDESKHLSTNVISCETCHNSHAKNPQGELLKGEYNTLCASCHDRTFDITTTMPDNSVNDGTTGNNNVTTKSHRF